MGRNGPRGTCYVCGIKVNSKKTVCEIHFRMNITTKDPTPSQIQNESKAIQQTWSERQFRRAAGVPVQYEIPIVRKGKIE